MIKNIGIAIVFLLSFGFTNPSSPLASGSWRAELARADGNNIVFNFDVKDSSGITVMHIRNAGERLLVDDIHQVGDSLIIKLPFFESEIHAKASGNSLSGYWYKHLATRFQLMPFSAVHGREVRFAQTKAPAGSVSGRWSTQFKKATHITNAIGEFTQTGSKVTGTFLTTTGDYRFLEGIVDGDTLRLSCFDGGHAYYFKAHIANDSSLDGGQYYSGPTSVEEWTATRNEDAKLPDEFSIATVKPGAAPLSFSFRDIDGNIVSFPNKKFEHKVVLLQVMGSWCPNCMDETGFLSGFYKEYKAKGVEMIALAYERTTDFNRSQKSLRSFQQRFNITYPVLVTGVTSDDSLLTEKTLPQIDHIAGFPTTIFVDKKGQIRKIHTGFAGPGTGDHYKDEQRAFTTIVDELLSE